MQRQQEWMVYIVLRVSCNRKQEDIGRFDVCVYNNDWDVPCGVLCDYTQHINGTWKDTYNSTGKKIM